MEIRGDLEIKVGSDKYERIRLAILDMYINTQNATLCYEIFRRAVSGNQYRENRANASNFFKRDDNKDYMDNRREELDLASFKRYAKKHNVDISKHRSKTDKYYDIENLTTDEIRAKNLTELEELKEVTEDPIVLASIIKQQTDLMDAKRREKDISNTDTFIKYYLPYPDCTCYKKKFKNNGKINED